MKRVLLVLGAGLLLALAAPAHAASAHPLGNFSVNQLDALDLYPDRIQVAATVDVAELPTLQERSTVDSEGPVAFAARTCAALGHDLAVTVAGHRLEWTVTASTFGYHPGAAGLSTSRLDCTLTAPADLTRPSTVDVTNRYRADRIGWRELTAAGHGVALIDPPVPARSVSDGLRSYPKDLLSSPLDERSARLAVRPGAGVAATAAAVPVSRAGWSARAEAVLQNLVGGRTIGPLVGLLAVLLAIALGAGHALLPGHGKTVMAAYLAGRDGRPRDALVVGATVTATHTGGVLLLGLLLTTVAGLAGEIVLGWLGVASGLLVAGVGVAMLIGARRRHRHAHDHHHDHPHPHPHRGRLATVGMGIAGGLVPSPSALVILLGAIGLGRTVVGVLLVLGYGLGMAATLTAAGLLLIRVRDRWAPRVRWHRLSTVAGHGTAAVVLLVGLGLAARSLPI